MLKKLFLVLPFFSFIFIFSQNTPTGVNFIKKIKNSSFIYKDNDGVIWRGGGAINKNSIRANDGLQKFTDSGMHTYYTSGIFTDMLEMDSQIIFTNYLSIYTFKNNQFFNDTSLNNSTCIAKFNQKIIIGTYGNGLYEKTSTGFQKIPILINGIEYNYINSIAAYSNELWIGTNSGLIKYNGQIFEKYTIPVKHTWNSNIRNNYANIISVQKDKDGKVWVLNNNSLDSLECLFFLENSTFKSALEYYKNICAAQLIIPYTANKLTLNSSGNLLLGIDNGVLVLENNNLRYFQVNTFFNNNCKVGSLACGDSKGNIYLASDFAGLFKINPSKYNNINIINQHNLSFNLLDINDVKANVSNTGIHAMGSPNNLANLFSKAMSTPNIGCASPLFSGAIWVGGIKNNTSDLHIAAETYRQSGSDFKPGPIDLITKTYDSTANSFYNKIWKINRQTIDEFLTNRNKPNYVIPEEILDWPAHGRGNFAKNLAPFTDVDANGLYEPQKGDYPKIKGDQMLWWVFNDLGEHKETKGTPLSVEIHGSCYAYFNINIPITDSNYIMNRSVFYSYKIINRSNHDYDNFYSGIWNDIDIGFQLDDYMGCDTFNNASFGYNSSNFDIGNNGYGKNPPVLFCQFLNKKMNTFTTYNNDFNPVNGNPNISDDYYRYMKGPWSNTKHVNIGKICDYKIIQNGNTPADKRSVMATSLPLFKKDSSIQLDFVYSLLHNSEKNWLIEDCEVGNKSLKKIQNWYNKNQFPSKPYWGLSVNEIEKNKFTVFPNPSNSILNIQTSIYSEKVTSIELIDITGKIIEKQLSNTSNIYFNTTFDISKIATGIYIIKINTDNGSLTQKIIKE